MERWIEKVAIVTGASSGIGASVIKNLAQAGLKVIGIARRVEEIERLASSLNDTSKGKIYAIKCNIRNESEILKVFQWVEKEFGGVDVMINCAGCLYDNRIMDATTEEFRNILEVNVLATAICSREAIKSMSNRKVPGHIININSILGHYAPAYKMPLNIYCASKYAITGMSYTLRNDIEITGLDIKLTSINPGLVNTDMISEKFQNSFREMNVKYQMLDVQDIADAVIYSLSAPPRVQIDEIVLTAHHIK